MAKGILFKQENAIYNYCTSSIKMEQSLEDFNKSTDGDIIDFIPEYNLGLYSSQND